MISGLSCSDDSIFWTAIKNALLWFCLVLVMPPSYAYHEASEPSDGTVNSFKPVDPPSLVPEIYFYKEGGTASIADFRGKVVLLNLWATWCPPCIRELPGLDRLQARFADEDFVVLPISIDDEGLEIAAPFYERLEIKHLGLYGDPAKQLNAFFPVDVLPASFILDRQGRVIAYLRSYVDWDDADADKMFRGLLAGQSILFKTDAPTDIKPAG